MADSQTVPALSTPSPDDTPGQAARLRDSLRAKLIALTAATVAVIVAALAVYFPARELHDLDDKQRGHAATYGALLAAQVRAAVAAADREAARGVLGSLAIDPDVVALVLTGNGGQELVRQGTPSAAIPPGGAHGDAPDGAHGGAGSVVVVDDRIIAVTPISGTSSGGSTGSGAGGSSGSGATLMIELSNARIAADRRRLALAAAVAGGCAIAFGAFAAYLIARSLVRRLRAIIDVVSSVAQDAAPRMVPADSYDEIGVLGRAFNHMLLRLHADRARLHQTVIDLTGAEEQLAGANRELEQRVAARTRALSDANRQLKLEMKHRSAMEIELRQAQKLESVGRLASGIAHEINTPVQFVSDSCAFLETASEELLRVIATYRDALAAAERRSLDLSGALARTRAIEAELDLGYLAEQIPLAIQRSLQGLARVSAIVRAMKEFAYPDRIEQAPSDINRAISSTLTVAHNEYKYIAEIETDLQELPMVTCHIGELNQVVLNIVVNAAHAIEARGFDGLGKIIVRTAARAEEVQIIIQDNGCGIPDAVMDKIFDPFFTTKEIGKGTGQGLAIARAVVVDKHHGKLDVNSRVGEGTIFTITLPIHGISHARGTTQIAPVIRPPDVR